MPDFSFTIQSTVAADKATVWQYITQMQNVNAELMPYVYMTYPKDRAAFGGEAIPLNEVLFKSTLLLFGFIPIDIHSLRFANIDYGTAFYEDSYTLQHRYWKHTRSLHATGHATIVTDELHFLPRLPLMGYMLLPFIKTIFTNRHKKLRARFN